MEAERKMGEMLLGTERAQGFLKRGPVVTACNHGETPTLAEIGLTKRESAAAQMLAELPAVEFEKIKTGKKTKAVREVRAAVRLRYPLILTLDRPMFAACYLPLTLARSPGLPGNARATLGF